MKIIPFKGEHLAELLSKPSQACLRADLDIQYEDLAAFESYTGMLEGRIVVCTGLIHVWPGRSIAWAFIADDIGVHGMVSLTRAVQRFLNLRLNERIEAAVEADFLPGHRWARMLGFERETPGVMRHFFADGKDAVLYARVS